MEQRVPGGDPRTGEGCNLEIAQVRGRQGEGVRVHEQMLLCAAIGVTAQCGSNGLLRGATADPARKEVGRHAVAWSYPGHVRSDRYDFTAAVGERDPRFSRRAAGHDVVSVVQTRGPETDQGLATLGRRHRPLLDGQTLRTRSSQHQCPIRHACSSRKPILPGTRGCGGDTGTSLRV